MSTRNKLIVGVVATLVVVAAALVAHPPRLGRRAAMHTLMAGYLDLNESQKAEAEAIFKSAHESAEPLWSGRSAGSTRRRSRDSMPR